MMEGRCSCGRFAFSYPASSFDLKVMSKWYWHKLRGHKFAYRWEEGDA